MSDNKKLLLRLAAAIIFIAIVVYTLKDSAGEIVKQLENTSVWIVLSILISALIYQFFEGFITYTLAKKYNNDMKLRYGLSGLLKN